MVVAVKILQLAKEIIEERKLAKEEVDESMVSSSLGKDAGVSLPMTCRWRITHQSYGGGYIFKKMSRRCRNKLGKEETQYLVCSVTDCLVDAPLSDSKDRRQQEAT